ncbi:MAG: hypothetical protein OEZ06_11035 [Myxococcales bacterium]|nr:hypothetical protein [Myxococcales bacterium]
MLELLIFLNLGVACLALIRARPAAVILGLSQVVVLRGLSSVRDFGQTAAFLPGAIFSDGNIETATFIFAGSTVAFAVAALVGPRSKSSQQVPGMSLPRVPAVVLALIGIYFLAYSFAAGTILEHSYGTEDLNRSALNIGGARVLMYAILIYEAYRRVLMQEMSPVTGIVGIFFLCAIAELIRGSTGIPIGILFTSSVMLFLGIGTSSGLSVLARGFPLVMTSLLATALVVVVVRIARQDVSTEGINVVFEALEKVGAQESERAKTGRGLEKFANGIQGAEHVLECITLHDSGYSRSWRSAYAPIEYTFKPAFLLKPLGLERSKEAPWELGDYYIHGGGINVIGEFYWNGGYLCVITLSALLAWFAFLCDTRYRGSAAWLMMLCNFGPGLLMGYEYGWAQICRGAINGCIVIGAYVVWRKFFGRRSGALTPMVSPERPLVD